MVSAQFALDGSFIVKVIDHFSVNHQTDHLSFSIQRRIISYVLYYIYVFSSNLLYLDVNVLTLCGEHSMTKAG